MAYRPPSGIAVVLDFDGVYIPPDGDAVELDFANAAIWTTLSVGVSMAVQAPLVRTAGASAYVVQRGLTRSVGVSALLAIPRTRTTGADFVVPGAELLTAGAGAALQKKGTTRPATASVCIGVPRSIVAAAGFAELGLRRTVATAVDFLPRGIEPFSAGALVMKALSQATTASAYCTRAGLTRTTTADAMFSSLRRSYASSAVQGTTGRSALLNAALQRNGMTVTTGTGAAVQRRQSATPMADGAVQGHRRLLVGVNAPLGRFRARTARLEALLGATHTVDLGAGALVRQALGLTTAGSVAVQRAATRRIGAGAAVQDTGRWLAAGLDAVLRVVPDSDAVDETTPFDDEWEPLARPIEWAVPERAVEWAGPERAAEWVLSD